MTIEQGNLVYIDYIGKVKETGEVFDTTIEEEAKKANIYRSDQEWEPMLVAVGESWVVKGLDKALVGKEKGQEFEVEVAPSEGFGERDPKKIVLYTKRKLLEANIKDELRPGMIVNVDGLPAVVRVAGGGRALLDFNPPLAGKTLIYKVFIRSICSAFDEKVRALIKRRSRKLAEKKDLFRYREKKRHLVVKLAESDMLLQNIQLIKRGIANDIFKFLPEVLKMQFVEELENPTVKEEARSKPGIEPPQPSGGQGGKE
ncbi:MAG: FKBP-type peptidyl-prolyl cis-trans isomerase [Candidatus Geothermarchaeales archaeon]